MKLNKKGYSLIELFAVIFITSALIWPMLTTLVNNIEMNDRIHDRRSAASMAQGTMEGFTRMDFVDVQTLVNDANNSGTYYVEFDSTSCTQLDEAIDINLCNELFSSVFNNLSLDNTKFKVYIFNYNLTTAMQSSLLNSPNLPDSIKEEIQAMSTTNDPNPELYHIYTWIEYSDDPYFDLILGGLLSNE